MYLFQACVCPPTISRCGETGIGSRQQTFVAEDVKLQQAIAQTSVVQRQAKTIIKSRNGRVSEMTIKKYLQLLRESVRIEGKLLQTAAMHKYRQK